MSSVFPPGIQLATRYRVLRLLETNHVGALYEAERFDASLAHEGELRAVTGRRVALKWLRFAAGAAAQLAHQRAALARAACTIRHPHLALVHDVALEGSSLFVVSELLVGESLRARLAPHSMPLHERLRALAEAMSALAFAHQRGLVHGGLHPGNIFLHQPHDPCFGLPPVVKVHDFGTATTTLPQSLAYPGERSPFGPHAYLDHAQLCGREPDVQSDIYACGVLLYQALTGSVPFAASVPVELAIKLATTSASPIGDRHPGLPASLDALIQQTLRKERSERPLQLEPLAALTSAYAETLAARELLARGDPSLVTRRMIQPARMMADSARLDVADPAPPRETRPIPVVDNDAEHGQVTQLLTVIGPGASAAQPSLARPTARFDRTSASPVPLHSSHPPAYLAALEEAEIAAALDLARIEAAQHDAEFARPLRHEEFDVRPLHERPQAHDSQPPPLASASGRTQRGLSAQPLPELAYDLEQTTVTMAVPLLDPDLAQGTPAEHVPLDATPHARAFGPSHARVTRDDLEQERVVEISRHPTVVGTSPAAATQADAAHQGYVEVVARTRVRPALQLNVASPPSVLDEVKHGLSSGRVRTWSAAVAAVLVVAGISVSFAMATNRDVAKSAPPALPNAARSEGRDEPSLARTRRQHASRDRTEDVRLAPSAPASSAQDEDQGEGEAESFAQRTAQLVQGHDAPGDTDGAVGRVAPLAPREHRQHRERARERAQRTRPGSQDDGYLVGPLPTADQF